MEDVCCRTIQCNVNIRRAVGIVPTISGCNYIFCLERLAFLFGAVRFFGAIRFYFLYLVRIDF